MVWLRLIFLLFLSFQVNSNELTEQELQYFNFLDLNNDKYISVEEINKVPGLGLGMSKIIWNYFNPES